MEKAYDHINWSFLLKVLQNMGFGIKWVKWIRWCISTPSFSVLVNGSSTGFFKSSRGLRQGDPLSPYLFVLGMEALSILLDKAVYGGYISRHTFKGRNGSKVTIIHLLFVDDTLIFFKDSVDQLSFLGWTLAWFEALLGLRINLVKFVIILIGNVESGDQLATELGCRLGSLLSDYLGLPLGSKFNSSTVWDKVEERFGKHLAIWKRQHISKGGRLTLIKSTLSNMPTYFLSLFRIPMGVSLRLEKIQRDFLWGGGNLDKKIHLVKWKTVSFRKENGGLGLRSLFTFNRALLGKWNWSFAMEDNCT